MVCIQEGELDLSLSRILCILIPELLAVIRETENDDLTNVMQKLVCTYAEDIIPLAVEITTQLVSQSLCITVFWQ